MSADGYLFDHTQSKIVERLKTLEDEHRQLDDQIKEIYRKGADMLTLQRLKREKLRMRDQIFMLRDRITPDIIA